MPVVRYSSFLAFRLFPVFSPLLILLKFICIIMGEIFLQKVSALTSISGVIKFFQRRDGERIRSVN